MATTASIALAKRRVGKAAIKFSDTTHTLQRRSSSSSSNIIIAGDAAR